MPGVLAVMLLAVVACGSSTKPVALSQATEIGTSNGEERPIGLDKQTRLRLVYCVGSEGTSANDAANVIRARLGRRDDVVVKAEGGHVVLELPSNRDAGPIDSEEAAAELAAALRSRDLPQPVPCEPEAGTRSESAPGR